MVRKIKEENINTDKKSVKNIENKISNKKDKKELVKSTKISKSKILKNENNNNNIVSKKIKNKDKNGCICNNKNIIDRNNCNIPLYTRESVESNEKNNKIPKRKRSNIEQKSSCNKSRSDSNKKNDKKSNRYVKDNTESINNRHTKSNSIIINEAESCKSNNVVRTKNSDNKKTVKQKNNNYKTNSILGPIKLLNKPIKTKDWSIVEINLNGTKTKVASWSVINDTYYQGLDSIFITSCLVYEKRISKYI